MVVEDTDLLERNTGVEREEVEGTFLRELFLMCGIVVGMSSSVCV